VVVVGVDPEDVAVLVNDPERGKLLRIERAEFEKACKEPGIGRSLRASPPE